MIFPTFSAPILSDDLQAIIGLAIVDGGFQELLLANPRQAVADLDLAPADRRAAGAVTGASSLAEYAMLLEQRLARIDRRRVALRREPSGPRQPARKAG